MRIPFFTLASLAVISGSAAAEPTPAQRAKELVTAQLALIQHRDQTLADLFTPDVVVLSQDGCEEYDCRPPFNLIGEEFDIAKTSVRKLTVGGTADVIVIIAEVDLTNDTYLAGEHWNGTSVVDLTELLVDVGGSWKVVAAAFGTPPSGRTFAEPVEKLRGATTAGPLTPLLASPTALLAALGKEPTVSVLGTGKSERGFGPAKAKKLLTSWRKLDLRIEGAPREVRTATYGFAEANIQMVSKKGASTFYRGLLIALPAPGGGWKVVAVQYVEV